MGGPAFANRPEAPCTTAGAGSPTVAVSGDTPPPVGAPPSVDAPPPAPVSAPPSVDTPPPVGAPRTAPGGRTAFGGCTAPGGRTGFGGCTGFGGRAVPEGRTSFGRHTTPGGCFASGGRTAFGGSTGPRRCRRSARSFRSGGRGDGSRPRPGATLRERYLDECRTRDGLSDPIRCGIVRCGFFRCHLVRCRLVRCHLVRCRLVRCHLVRCRLVRCRLVRCSVRRMHRGQIHERPRHGRRGPHERGPNELGLPDEVSPAQHCADDGKHRHGDSDDAADTGAPRQGPRIEEPGIEGPGIEGPARGRLRAPGIDSFGPGSTAATPGRVRIIDHRPGRLGEHHRTGRAFRVMLHRRRECAGGRRSNREDRPHRSIAGERAELQRSFVRGRAGGARTNRDMFPAVPITAGGPGGLARKHGRGR